MGDTTKGKTHGQPLTIELDADRAAWLRRKTASTGNAEARGLALVMLTRAIDAAREEEAYQDARADVRLAYDQGITDALETIKQIAAESLTHSAIDALEAATWRGYRDELHAQRIAFLSAFNADQLDALRQAIEAEALDMTDYERARVLMAGNERTPREQWLYTATMRYREAERALNAALYMRAGEEAELAYNALQEARALNAPKTTN